MLTNKKKNLVFLDHLTLQTNESVISLGYDYCKRILYYFSKEATGSRLWLAGCCSKTLGHTQKNHVDYLVMWRVRIKLPPNTFPKKLESGLKIKERQICKKMWVFAANWSGRICSFKASLPELKKHWLFKRPRWQRGIVSNCLCHNLIHWEPVLFRQAGWQPGLHSLSSFLLRCQ